MDFDAVAEKASAQSGIAWTSSLVNLVRLCLVEPGLWLLVIGSSVPTLAALVVLLMARDITELKTLLRRFNPMGIESWIRVNCWKRQAGGGMPRRCCRMVA